jgi:hypothetical protein
VVTSNTDRLRFESFSSCCGVHARLDLPPGALATPPVTSGTTNVDFNPPMRAALAGAVATASQILLKVGDEEFTAVTEVGSVTERKVDLPDRWVKGFGEVSALHAGMRLVAEVGGLDASRFLSSRSHRHGAGHLHVPLVREAPGHQRPVQARPRRTDRRQFAVGTGRVSGWGVFLRGRSRRLCSRGILAGFGCCLRRRRTPSGSRVRVS